ncbi:MAG: hypothetical protein AMS26_18175 [Bacteroides sp. SM23_62]|nr:MAG: hypothetical protein AMS26_18175 [Bacteroides sp. SM23_62]
MLIPFFTYPQETPEENMASEPVDTTQAFVKIWNLTEDFAVMRDKKIDTMKTQFQIYDPVFSNSIANAFLGNTGLQTQNLIYFNQEKQPDFFFMRPYTPYLYTPENNTYFNITKPFTLLEYFSTAGNKQKREDIFHAIHTQNLSPFLNLGFDIRLLSSAGLYSRQKGKLTNFNLFGSYTGHDYSFHTSFHVNNTSAEENGGIADDSIFYNENIDEKAYDINLEEADSRIRSLMFHFTQRYKFGKEEQVADTTSETGFRRWRDRTVKTGSLLHTLEYQRSYRLYTDDITDRNRDFYPAYYIDSTQTRDSTHFRSLRNTVQVMLDENPHRKNDFGARAFISHQWVRYAFNTANDTLVSDGDTSVMKHKYYQYNDVHLGASVLHTVGGGWDWIFAGRFYLLGYRSGDLVLDANITKRFQGKKGESRISISGNFSLQEADHFLNFYESNHFRWYNDFRKIKDIRGSLEVSNEAIQFEAGAHLSLVTDLVYYTDSARPAQHGGVVSLIGLDLHKHFRAGIFHSDHRIHYQLGSDNNVVRLPDLSYYTSNYISFTVVKNALTAQIGFDLYYYTRYRALAFAPSSGLFYNQDIKELGNYPYLNPFLTAKLKRTRFYLRYDHPYAGLIKKNYFHVLNYPMPGRLFRFGLSWTFYD